MRVTFLFDGNSGDVNEWSNVPYFLTEGFKENGCEINRVNMHIKVVSCIIKIPIIAEGSPQSCSGNFPIIAEHCLVFP